MGRNFGIGLIEYRNYKRVHGRSVGMDVASVMAQLATQRYRTIEVLGFEAFSWPSVRVQELLLVDEVVNIGRHIQATNEMNKIQWGE